MPLAPERVLSELIEAKKFAPVYFLAGEENFYLDQITNWIEGQVLTPSERSFNQSVWYGKDVSLRQVLLQARQFPVMAQRQVLIVKEAQEIAELTKDAGRQLLMQYLEKPVPTTLLVFVYRHKTLTLTSKFAKALDKHAVFVYTKKLYDNQVPTWIQGYLKSKQYSASPEAVYLLSEHIGNDLSRLATELDKLFLNLPLHTRITPELVQEYVGIHKSYNIFEFQKAIGERNTEKAYRIAHYFAANPKAHPVIPLIASLFGYFTKLLLIHHSRDKSKGHLAGLLRLPPFVVPEYVQASQRYPLDRTLFAIACLQEADMQSKGVPLGRVSEHDLLRDLIFRLTVS
ncbi:MAG: DNA polymerase III subunit delta [Bernardetiaceae bacterium]